MDDGRREIGLLFQGNLERPPVPRCFGLHAEHFAKSVGGVSMVLLKEAGLLVFFGLIALMLLAIIIVAPLFGIFQARCMTRVYDCAAPAEPAPL